MLAVYISPEIAYPSFTMWVLAIWMVIFVVHEPWQWQSPMRSQMFLMSACGVVGSLVVGSWHRADFWNPLSVGDVTIWGAYWSPWDSVFGGAFTGITTTLLQLFGGKRLEKEYLAELIARESHLRGAPFMTQRQRRRRKVIHLASIVLVGLGCYYLLWWDSLTSAIVAYAFGAWLLHRHGSIGTALQGGLLTLVV